MYTVLKVMKYKTTTKEPLAQLNHTNHLVRAFFLANL